MKSELKIFYAAVKEVGFKTELPHKGKSKMRVEKKKRCSSVNKIFL